MTGLLCAWTPKRKKFPNVRSSKLDSPFLYCIYLSFFDLLLLCSSSSKYKLHIKSWSKAKSKVI